MIPISDPECPKSNKPGNSSNLSQSRSLAFSHNENSRTMSKVHIDTLLIKKTDKEGIIAINKFACPDVEFKHSDVMSYLLSVSVDTVSLEYDDTVVELLDKKWLKTIKTIRISKLESNLQLEAILPKLQCTSLTLTDNMPFEINGVRVLDCMESVEKLKIENCNLSTKFLQKLAGKSHLGSGIQLLFLSSGCQFSDDAFVEFLVSARFRKPPQAARIYLFFKNEDNRPLVDKMIDALKKREWKIIKATNGCFDECTMFFYGRAIQMLIYYPKHVHVQSE